MTNTGDMTGDLAFHENEAQISYIDHGSKPTPLNYQSHERRKVPKHYPQYIQDATRKPNDGKHRRKQEEVA